ncbi:hypothetical protein SETIT_5G311100v2 [Setaria italica]|uniref:Secreted protein n=2 Tax=Setaria TaxID=4554 RepID=A0A368RAS4_SETIT|nr:hypothetical protein SETIT_5G311100v2 [Setaria italica]TKW16662.1 hypothetical protein SEVIR_5G313800v2 [Setaria viridis]
MTFLQPPRRSFLHPLQWHRWAMLFMYLAMSQSAGSFTQSEEAYMADQLCLMTCKGSCLFAFPILRNEHSQAVSAEFV